LFRTLQPGVNPDEEIGRHLATSGFRHVPAPLGAIRFFDGTGSAELAGFAQAFVSNHGDGWTWLLDRLRPLAQGEVSDADEIVAAIATLGRTTAELHVALASGPVDPAFSPAPATGEEISVLRRLAEGHLDETLAALKDRRPGLGAEDRQRVDRVLATERSLTQVLAGFGEEVGLARIRVHGDYHLGQVLRSVEGGWTIIDFEGEPARPLEERRRKTSPLKDVAGMLRSFAYARGILTGEQVAPQGGALLAEWERAARASFLAAYRTEIASSPTPLVPTDDAAFGLALAAWELDKALYEVRYELANRPDWLSIPLATLLPTDA
jgi:maltose alpha-D-glucosyltransferase/alpha-amylase